MFVIGTLFRKGSKFILWYKDSFCGVSDVDSKKTISYIEVFVE